MKSTYGPALCLMLVFFTGTVRGDGDLASLLPLHSVANISSYLNQQRVKDELNLTKQQDIAIQKIMTKSGQKMGQDAETIFFKLSGPDKYAKVRALSTTRAEELFQALGQTLTPRQLKRLKQISLQHWGITLFDHPEIRNALHLSEAQVANLKAIHKQIQDQLAKEVIAKRISQKEGQKQYMVLTHSIADSVRAALTEEQRKKLQDLLGQPYLFE